MGIHLKRHEKKEEKISKKVEESKRPKLFM